MLSVKQWTDWEALPDETKELARAVLGLEANRLTYLQERIEEMENDLGRLETRDMHIVDEIKRVEEAVANAHTLMSNGIKDVNTMLRGLKSRLT